MSSGFPSSRPCSYFNTPGGCRRGSTCTFSHSAGPTATSTGPSSLIPSSSVAPATQYGRICTYWSERGFCKKGDMCTFQHTSIPGSSSYAGGMQEGVYGSGPYTDQLLAGYSTGPYTDHSIAVAYPPTPYSDRIYPHQPQPPLGYTVPNESNPIRICTFWAMKGQCKMGDTCKFSHAGPPGAGKHSLYGPTPILPSWSQGGMLYDPMAMSNGYPPYMSAGTPSGHNGLPGARDFGGFGVRAPPPRAKFCNYYNIGKCKKGATCDFLHAMFLADDAPEPERRVCTFFKEGSCKKGNLCDHLHVVREREKEEIIQRIERNQAENLNVPCPFYWDTHCKKGLGCENLHIMPRERVSQGTRICQFFETHHFCKKNNICEFMHAID
eukprot:Ihof_evm4s12 gene=Ihof_evmTU4s12